MSLCVLYTHIERMTKQLESKNVQFFLSFWVVVRTAGLICQFCKKKKQKKHKITKKKHIFAKKKALFNGNFQYKFTFFQWL